MEVVCGVSDERADPGDTPDADDGALVLVSGFMPGRDLEEVTMSGGGDIF